MDIAPLELLLPSCTVPTVDVPPVTMRPLVKLHGAGAVALDVEVGRR